MSGAATTTRLHGGDESLRSLFEHHPDAVYLLDLNGVFLDANPALLEMVGLPKSAVIGQSYEPMVVPEHLEFVRSEFQAACEGKPRRYQADGIHPEKGRFTVEVTNIPCFENGRVTGVYGIAKDITEAREAIEQARRVEQQYRSLFDHHPDAVFRLDAMGRVVRVNRTAARLLGFRREEIQGKSLDDLVAPDEQEVNREHFRAVLAGETRVFETVDRRADGTPVPIQVIAMPDIRDGDVVGVFGIVRSLEDERRRARELEASEARMRAIYEHSMDAIMLADPDRNRLLACNRATEELFGLTEAELVNRNREQLFDMADPAARAFFAERERAGQARGRFAIRRGDDTLVPVETASAVFTDKTGARRSTVILRDITDFVERQRELEAGQERLSELTAQQREILNSLFARVAVVQDDGTLLFNNDRWGKASRSGELPELGLDAGADYLAALAEFSGPEAPQAGQVRDAIQEIFAGKERRVEFEIQHLRRSEPRWTRIAVTPFSAEGKKGAVVAALDVTERRAAEARRRLITAAFQSSREAMLICDRDFLVLEANDAYLRYTGLERRDALESRPSFLEIENQARSVGQALATQGHWQGELLQRRVNGETFISHGTINRVSQPDGEPDRLVITFSDISELREARRRVDYLAFHDPLTDAPNIAALRQWLQQQLAEPDKAVPLLLVHIDLDRTKAVNESLGHGAGDELLRGVAQRLREHCGTADYLARLHGDEFALVKASIKSEQRAKRFARGLLDELKLPFKFGRRTVNITATAGLCLFPGHAQSLEDLLGFAQAAVNEAKREQRDNLLCYHRGMHQAVRRRYNVERGLQFALEREELFLEYQPILRLADGVVCGAEALLRWQNPKLGRVGPNEFIQAAEETGLITEIGHWVMEQACRQAARWREMSPEFREVSVNVSPVQFLQDDFVSRVRRLIKKERVSGECLRLEITESFMMLEPEWSITLMDQLRGLGFALALDDFGTGYSSMTYLRRLPVNYVKLDRSFTQRLPKSRADGRIMESVINLSHSLNLKVVAEGIETEDQHQILRAWGCDEGQGFLFAKPMGAEKFESLIRDGRPLS